MTTDSEKVFQRKYHDYSTQDEAEAKDEAARVNETVNGFEVEAVSLGDLGWCLMLKQAASEGRRIGIIPVDVTES